MKELLEPVAIYRCRGGGWPVASLGGVRLKEKSNK